MKRILLGLLLASGLCPWLAADTVTYYQGKEIEQKSGVTVKSWSWEEVEFDKTTVKRDVLVSVVRTTDGSMSSGLSQAIDLLGVSPAEARPKLEAASKSGNNLDKEEATYLLGYLDAMEAETSPAKVDAAVAGMGAYVKAYPKGFFAKEAYTTLAQLQIAAGQPEAARKTLSALARAGTSLDVEGNQRLGELEFDQGRWDDAVKAFRAASSAASSNKVKKALAEAWTGRSLLAKGDLATARSTLKAIVEDDKLEADGTEDEAALSVAWPAYADVLFAENELEQAYDSYLQGAYYSWWMQGAGEGYCLAQAWRCTRKLADTKELWKKRKEKLEDVLKQGFPAALKKAQDAENE